jgi:hypothetical protein
MKMRMRTPGNKLKIRKFIIQLVAINMMNQLLGRQLSAQVLFHYMTMFQDKFSVNCNNPITLCGNSSFTASSPLSKMGIAISVPSQIVAITHSPFFGWLLAIQTNLLRKRKRMVAFTGTKLTSSSFDPRRFDMELFPAVLAIFYHGSPPEKQYMTDTSHVSRGKRENRMNSGKPVTDNAVGNPEPSPWYTKGRCRDHRRGLAPLITGLSVRPERDEMIRTHGNMGLNVHEGYPACAFLGKGTVYRHCLG